MKEWFKILIIVSVILGFWVIFLEVLSLISKFLYSNFGYTNSLIIALVSVALITTTIITVIKKARG